MNRVRVGIVGTGTHGSRYAGHVLHDVEELELVAICRRSGEGREQAAQWGCTWHRDWRDLVNDRQVDAVISVVPPGLNVAIARACAGAAKPLLMEKPLAVNSAAAAEIVSFGARHGLRLTVGQTLRYNQVVRQLREHLPAIGTLFSFSASQRLEPSTLAWHGDPAVAGAGVTFHTAVHVFDALRFITGLEVRRVMAVCRRLHNPAMEDLVAVLVEMEGDVVGTIDCSKVGHARSGRFEFVGRDGQLQGDQVHNMLVRVQGSDLLPLPTGSPENTIVPLLRDWYGYLAGSGENPIPATEGFAAVRLCEACLASARSGNWVELKNGG